MSVADVRDCMEATYRALSELDEVAHTNKSKSVSLALLVEKLREPLLEVEECLGVEFDYNEISSLAEKGDRNGVQGAADKLNLELFKAVHGHETFEIVYESEVED